MRVWPLGRITINLRVIVLFVGLILAIVLLLYTNKLARVLHEKEQNDVKLWVAAMERVSGDVNGNIAIDPLISHIVSTHTNIPFIITDEYLNPVVSNRIEDEVFEDAELYNAKLEELSNEYNPRVVTVRDVWGLNTKQYIIYYGQSDLLKALYYFPYVLILIIIIFLVFTYIALQSTKRDEQNQVWIGLAKETAHQLGTPISSLLGWVEYMRSQDIDPTVVDEIEKDVSRLTTIVDRFSKIGAETILTPNNVNEVVGASIMYFRTRIPRNVTLSYNGLAMAPVKANINVALFEWVIENLLKNSLDAIQGMGSIDVKISYNAKQVFIDVSDTGKGIAKGNWSRIFKPGYTTKTRGWGLGLSLSRRIVKDYHHGKIFVLKSEVGHGTTFRIILKQVFE
ncbi:MAG: HAMP domain-containing sensor histidine kinase [Alistipes sp.]|nr:HAMP domain-containing sensor histidine kinase [Alistipes sp.]